MADLLHRIDAAVDGLCPCGAEPAPGSAYCGDECRPTHRGPDTDARRDGGPHAARWRPELEDEPDSPNPTTAADEHTRHASPYVALGRQVMDRWERQENERALLEGRPQPFASTGLWALNQPQPEPEGWYWCDACHCTSTPELARDDHPDSLNFRGERILMRWYRCPHCHTPVPRDLYWFKRRCGHIDGMLLRVKRGSRIAEHCLGDWYLRECPDPRAVILRTWVRLQQEVAPSLVGRVPARSDRSPLDALAAGDRVRLSMPGGESTDYTVTEVDDDGTINTTPAAPTGTPVPTGMFWLPGPPADPEAPTLADLEGGIDLTPYLAPARARSTFDAYRSLPWRTRVVLWLRLQRDTLREDGLREWLWGWWGIWRHRFRRAVRRVRGRLVGGCPGHGRRTCFPCDWVRGKSAEVRWQADGDRCDWASMAVPWWSKLRQWRNGGRP